MDCLFLLLVFIRVWLGVILFTLFLFMFCCSSLIEYLSGREIWFSLLSAFLLLIIGQVLFRFFLTSRINESLRRHPEKNNSVGFLSIIRLSKRRVILTTRLKTEMCKIVPMLNFPIPAKGKQFRTFLGRVNWMALFIENLAEMKVPLKDLLRKTVRWSWEGGGSRKPLLRYAFCFDKHLYWDCQI